MPRDGDGMFSLRFYKSVVISIIFIVSQIFSSVGATGADMEIIYETDFNTVTDWTITGSSVSSSDGTAVITTESTSVVSLQKKGLPIPKRYVLEFKAKVDKYIGEQGLIIGIGDGITRVYLAIREDKLVYRNSLNSAKYFQMMPGEDYRLWRFEVDDGHAYIYTASESDMKYYPLFEFDMESRDGASYISFAMEKEEGLAATIDYVKLFSVPDGIKLPTMPMNILLPPSTEIPFVSYVPGSGNTYVNARQKTVDESKPEISIFKKDGAVFAPAKYILDSLGIKIAEWNGKEQKGTLEYKNKSISLGLYDKTYSVNGAGGQFSVVPYIDKGRTMLPIEEIASVLGFNILKGTGEHTVISDVYQKYSDYYDDVYFALKPEWREKIDAAEHEGLLKIRPVIMPEGDNVVNSNHHYGWPVATMTGDNIVVATRRRLSHDGSQNESSGVFVVRSKDRGETWGQMEFMQPKFAGGVFPGSMSCIGTNQNGDLIYKENGILRSADGGDTWVHYKNAFDDSANSGNLGPNMPIHPKFGMMIFNSKGTFLTSPNGYDKWTKRTLMLPVSGTDLLSDPAEPTSLVFGGNILLISREFNRKVGTVSNNGFAMSQHLYRYNPNHTADDITFETKPTNIIAGPATEWANDTAEVIMNPYNGRIEVIQSARRSLGPPDYVTKDDQGGLASLNIWSIDPKELLAGSNQWRFETTILVRYKQGNYQLDGMHPGGSVIDAKNNVQHIYVYAGRSYDERCGVFQITRTLDTERLKTFLNSGN